MFFKIDSWNFQHLFDLGFLETSQNVNSFREPIEKKSNEQNELKVCEVLQNPKSNRCWKFQFFILKKKDLLLKKYEMARIVLLLTNRWKHHVPDIVVEVLFSSSHNHPRNKCFPKKHCSYIFKLITNSRSFKRDVECFMMMGNEMNQ